MSVYDYDDESGDVQVLTDSPDDSTFIPDGLTSFPLQSRMIVIITDGE